MTLLLSLRGRSSGSSSRIFAKFVLLVTCQKNRQYWHIVCVLFGVVILWQLSCARNSVAPTKTERSVLLIVGQPKDAEVYVNDTFAGLVEDVRGGIVIRPGEHRLVVRRTQFETVYHLLHIGAGQTKQITVTLLPRFP